MIVICHCCRYCPFCKYKWLAPVVCILSVLAWYCVKTYCSIDSYIDVNLSQMSITPKTSLALVLCLVFKLNFIVILFYIFYQLKKKLENSIWCGPFFAISTLAYLCLMGELFYPVFDLMTRDGGPVDIFTYMSYVIFFATMFKVRNDFVETKKDKFHWGLFNFFALICLLREMGAQHWIPSRDSTAFKIRFFKNPMNPMHEKVIAGIIVLIIVVACLYAAYKWALPLVKGFLAKKNRSLADWHDDRLWNNVQNL